MVRNAGGWTGWHPNKLDRRRLLQGGILAGAGLASGVVLGCGSRSPKAGSSQRAAGAGAAGQPTAGGRLSVNVNNDPFDWDLSYVGKTLPNSNGIALAYESLLTDKRGPDVKYGDLVIQPLLAVKWENPDPQTYTFHLRPNVRFANLPPVNGRALASGDVQWSFEYWSRTGSFKGKNLPKAQFDWFFEGLDSVQAPDPATAVVRFKQPFAPFLNYASSDFNPIVPHEIYDQYGDLKDHMAGTGPWQLDAGASQKGSKWVWKKNPAYWDSGKPYLDEIAWLVLPDTATALSAFRSRQLDRLGNDILSCQQANELKRTDPAATAFTFPQPAWEIYMNLQVHPLDDERVRKAIGFAIDRDAFINSLDCGEGGWGLAGAFPTTFTQEEIKQIVHYDPQQAKQLLSAAGFGDGLDLEFICPGKEYGDTYIAEMQLLQAQLKKAGINLNLKSIDKADFSNSKKTYKFTITIQGKGDLFGDVDSYLFATFYSKSKANYGRVNDPELDRMILGQRQELDAAKRAQLVKHAIRYINEHALGLAIESRTQFEFVAPSVKNYAPQFGVHAIPQVDTWVQK
jgi:peptide/nickel transport system substrate-binding protein